MKFKSQALLLVILAMIPWMNSCDNAKEKLPELDGYYAIDVSEEGEAWDYWVVDEDGHYMLVIEQYGMPSTIFVKPTDNHDGYSIFMDDYGYPSKLVIDDYIFSFDNFNGNKVDIALIYPDGEVEVFREIETDLSWDFLVKKGTSEVDDWSDVIRIASHVAGAVSCGASIAGAAASGGIAIPLAVLSCGGFVGGIAAEVWPEDGLLGLESATVGAIATFLGCLNPTDLPGKISCYSGIASGSLTIASIAVEDIEERRDEVRIAEAALLGGYGDIQITLTWNNEADLDLHVVDPNGEEIYWSHKTSLSGGYLDYDKIDGYGPENVYWEDGAAPAGVYKVYVHHYDWDDAGYPTTAGYQVLINAFGFIESFSGTSSYDKTTHIASFNQSGLVSTNDVKKGVITTDKTKVK